MQPLLTWLHVPQRFTSSRFVAGTTVEDAMAAMRAMNELGLAVSIDNLGENVTIPGEAQQSAALYHKLLDEITVWHRVVSLPDATTGRAPSERVLYCQEFAATVMAASARLYSQLLGSKAAQ